jgi:outer membrane protein assembly factor BamD (BamD/ComL family)
MISGTGLIPAKRSSHPAGRVTVLVILVLLASLAGLAGVLHADQENPEAKALQLKAQKAFTDRHYAEAAGIDEKIAQKYPGTLERRFAVQMLGSIYEDNLVNIGKALKWDREYLKKYANPRQVSYYTEKIAALEKIKFQEDDFRIYKGIRFAGNGDAFMVKKFEVLLKEHPDFLLKNDVERELAYAYARLDKRKESFQAIQNISKNNPNEVSKLDRALANDNERYWKMQRYSWVAWSIVALLWALALSMRPWKHLSRASVRMFLILSLVWVLIIASSLPGFYGIDTGGDRIILKDSQLFLAGGLNLSVLLWIFLMSRGSFWLFRPRELRFLSPLLTLVMTMAVFYLFIVYQSNGPETIDVFVLKYKYLKLRYL